MGRDGNDVEANGGDHECNDASIGELHNTMSAEVDLSGTNQLARGLKSRHIQYASFTFV